MSLLLVLDFGGTKHTAALLDWPFSPSAPVVGTRMAEGTQIGTSDHPRTYDHLQWLAHQRQLKPPGKDAHADLQYMVSMAHGLLDGRKPAALGVSFGGPVDPITNVVRLSHHVPGWENVRLGEILQLEFNAPVAIDNDANVAGLGEFRFGAGREVNSLLYITISTGVGGGWIINGKRWHGADGMAGEIGHTVVDPLGPLCLCGKRGCVERLASGPYLAQDARDILTKEPQAGNLIRKLVSNQLESIDGQILSQAAAMGDPLASRLLVRAANALGVGIGNAANLVNPDRFILGGGISKSGPLFWETVIQAARQVALPQVHVEILPAALGDDAPLWGAVALAADLL